MTAALRLRDRTALPRLGSAPPVGPVVLDSNVFINALAGRGPPELKALLAALPVAFVSGSTLAEMSWTRGRLDPDHADTAKVLAAYGELLGLIDPAKVLTASAPQWSRAGELAGRAARAVAGGGRSIRTAFDRIELINDALSAVVTLDLGGTLITQDGDYDIFQQIEPAFSVLFYD